MCKKYDKSAVRMNVHLAINKRPCLTLHEQEIYLEMVTKD